MLSFLLPFAKKIVADAVSKVPDKSPVIVSETFKFPLIIELPVLIRIKHNKLYKKTILGFLDISFLVKFSASCIFWIFEVLTRNYGYINREWK